MTIESAIGDGQLRGPDGTPSHSRIGSGTYTVSLGGGASAEDGVALEREVSLSQASVWGRLDAFYEGATLGTWGDAAGHSGVPSFITSNALIGDIYAELVVAFLRDSLADCDVSEPVYILELGAGSGMFSFHCLKALGRRLRASKRLANVRVTYVMSDAIPAVVGAWDAVSSFDDFRADGRLDSAVFRADGDTEIRLRTSGALLRDARNPVIVLANYFFDCLRSDVFEVRGGRLHEVLYTFRDAKARGETGDGSLAGVSYTTRSAPASIDHYESSAWNQVLGSYAAEGGDFRFAVPVGGMQALDALRDIVGSTLCLIASDWGCSTSEGVKCTGPDFIAHADSASFSANLNAIARYAEVHGGATLATDHVTVPLHTLLAVVPRAEGIAGELDLVRAAFAGRLGGSDSVNLLFWLQQAVPSSVEAATPEMANPLVNMTMATIRGAHFDPYFTMSRAPLLLATVSLLHRELVGELLVVLRAVERNVYLGLPIMQEVLLFLAHMYARLGRTGDVARVLFTVGRAFRLSLLWARLLADAVQDQTTRLTAEGQLRMVTLRADAWDAIAHGLARPRAARLPSEVERAARGVLAAEATGVDEQREAAAFLLEATIGSVVLGSHPNA